MFRRHKRRHTNIVFVIFRLILSLIIFATLIAGLYYAYKHFSGVDPIKLDPKSSASSVLGFLSKLNLPKNIQNTINEKIPATQVQIHQDTPVAPKLVFKFALLADSHSDNIYLKRALDQIRKNYADVRFIIGLGDYTEVGTLDELKKAKIELDSSGFRYFVAPGDHDLWDTRNKQSLPSSDGKSLPPTTNYNQIFGSTYQSFIHENFKFIILYNSDNYLGLGEDQKNWLSSQLINADSTGTFIFLHEPLFSPSSDHFMGRVEQNLKIEAQDLIRQFSEKGVKKVFAGDTHFFSEYNDPSTNLPMVTIGAITSARNLQLSRFAIVYVYDDGSTRIEDVEVK